jgi:hypothetical protein
MTEPPSRPEARRRSEFPEETVFWGIEDENDLSDIDEYDDLFKENAEFIRGHRGSTTE